MEINDTTQVWQEKLQQCLVAYDCVSNPRNMEVREVISGKYVVPMPAYINLKARNVNIGFMFAEAAWILSGSNRLDELTPHIKGYARFSDDDVFMRGAYGPKVVDQLGYIVDTIATDNDSRQAVLNIWRERPGYSKDIPCTISMQFLLRDKKLHAVVTMRSNDVVLGFTYDVFTFSMVTLAVSLLLKARGIQNELGNLHVNAGSLHLYEDYYERASLWVEGEQADQEVHKCVGQVLEGSSTYELLVDNLKKGAESAKNSH